MKNKTTTIDRRLLDDMFTLRPISPELCSLLHQINAFMPAWFMQGIQHKERFLFNETGGFRGPANGGRRDLKETLHVSLNYKPPSGVRLSAIDKKLLGCTQEMLYEAKPFFFYSLQRVEEVVKVKNFAHFIMEHYPFWTARLLNYYPGNTQSLLAAPHSDRGCATWVMHETVHGHQNLASDLDTWRNMSIKDINEPQTAIFQLGLVGQLLTDCKIKAVCHKVLNLPESFHYGRRSIVVFADVPHIFLNKEKIRTSGIGTSAHDLFPLGANYKYGPNRKKEFAEWFIDKR